jgi:hypothetical protein
MARDFVRFLSGIVPVVQRIRGLSILRSQPITEINFARPDPLKIIFRLRRSNSDMGPRERLLGDCARCYVQNKKGQCYCLIQVIDFVVASSFVYEAR